MNTLSSYISFLHGVNIDYLREQRPENVLILDPDVQQISDVYRQSFESTITLRVWELDDGKTEQNPEGVYRNLRDDPEVLGRTHANIFTGVVKRFEQQAKERNLPFPAREQLYVHLINEPDTNNLMPQINTYTFYAVKGLNKEFINAEVFNFGTGHPAFLNSNQEPDWSPVEQSLELITGTNNVAVVHEYFNDLGMYDPSLNPWHIYRHKWAPRGPKYRIGEFGLDMILNGREKDHHGWKGILSEQEYLGNIYDYLSNVRDDVIGVRIFMTGFADKIWSTFNTEPLHDRLKKFYFESDSVAPPPSPPPLPPSVSAGLLDPNVLLAIMQVESGSGFDGGRLVIRFEAHIFKRLMSNPEHFDKYFKYGSPIWTGQQYRLSPNHAWENIHTGSQDSEYNAFTLARSIDSEAAYRSISMGRAQVMGFNHIRIGYSSAQEMYENFSNNKYGLEAQITGMVNFILTDNNLVAAIRNKDWRTIARIYNGSGNVDVYAPLLKSSYEKIVGT